MPADTNPTSSLFVAVGQTLLMMSLAEYCTIWPTAGGQQYYTQAVATGKYRPILSYLVGWAVLVGEISTGSSCAVNSAAIVASFVEITHPDLVWQVSILMDDVSVRPSVNSRADALFPELDDMAYIQWFPHCANLDQPATIVSTAVPLPQRPITGLFARL